MNRTLATGLLVLLGASGLWAQQAKVVEEGGTPDDYASARLAYFGQKVAVGQLAFNYGRPGWRAEYDDSGKFDGLTKGKVWRMGSNFWSNLYTDLPLTISGKPVAPGFYFLGLSRSADGASWSLAFIDPAKARAAHLDAFYIENAHVEFTAPMTTAPRREEAAQKLTITLIHKEGDLTNATLEVAFGHLALTAPITIALPR
jgi:hypothetical protein